MCKPLLNPSRLPLFEATFAFSRFKFFDQTVTGTFHPRGALCRDSDGGSNFRARPGPKAGLGKGLSSVNNPPKTRPKLQSFLRATSHILKEAPPPLQRHGKGGELDASAGGRDADRGLKPLAVLTMQSLGCPFSLHDGRKPRLHRLLPQRHRQRHDLVDQRDDKP